MNREKFLGDLAAELRRLPKEEYDKAMSYYVEFFDEAGVENEAEVIADLGTPKEVAAELIADTAMKRMEDPQKMVRKPFSTIWTVLLAVCAAPIALPLTAALVAVVVAFALAGFGVILSLVITEVAIFAAGFISAIIGFILLFSQPLTGIVNLGLGLVVIGASVLLGFAVLWVSKWLGRGISSLFRRTVKRRSVK